VPWQDGRAPVRRLQGFLSLSVSSLALDAFDFVCTVREGDFVAATPERLCGLYVIVDNPRLVSDLQEFLRKLGFIAAHPRGDGLDYLAIWQAIHPGARAFIAQSDRRVSDAA
jgi:hypothetical protein